MKKISQELDSEIGSLVSQLMGESVPVKPKSEPEKTMKYQLPVKHAKGGVEINEENKPWVIGAYSSTPFFRSVDKTIRPHYGVDLAAPKGSPVYPIGPGVVDKTQSEPKGRGGRTVHISHEDNKVVSYYAHLEKVHVSAGEKVDFNTIIGDLGDSGNAKGTQPHLHYEVRVNGKRVDPKNVTGNEIGSLSKKAQFIQNLIKKLDSFSEGRIGELKRIIDDTCEFQIRGSRKKNS